MLSLNTPPSHTVPSGPNMMAFHCMMFSACGDAFTPSGGSCCSRLKSLMSRLRAAVDMAADGAQRRHALAGLRQAVLAGSARQGGLWRCVGLDRLFDSLE